MKVLLWDATHCNIVRGVSFPSGLRPDHRARRFLHNVGGFVRAGGRHCGSSGHPWAAFWDPEGTKAGEARFWTSFFYTFLKFSAPFGPPGTAQERPKGAQGAENDAESGPRGSPKWSQKVTLTDLVHP